MLDAAHDYQLVPHDMDWEPVLGPVFDRDGKEIPHERGVYRGKHGPHLHTASDKYMPISHVSNLMAIEDGLREAGMDQFQSRVEAYEGGRKIRAEIVFPKHVITPKVGDALELRLDFRTSHDRTWSATNAWSYKRLICLNGMKRPDKLSVMRAKHTSGFNIDAFLKGVSAGVEMMATDEENFARLTKTPVSAAAAKHFFGETLAKRPKEFKRIKGVKDAPYRIEREYMGRLDTLTDHHDREEDATLWGVYNTMTWWSTHAKSKRNHGAGEHNSLIRREEKVAQALRSDAWKELEAA